MTIFGIGWHKTATHSLQNALDHLDFRGIHYPYEFYFKMKESDQVISSYLGSQNSFTDFPIPIYFKRIDELMPGSKFILTERDEQSWLTSIQKHFDLHEQPQERFGGLSENDYYIGLGVPIHEIHIAAYGQKEFDEDVFLKRYRKHNQEVRDYFSKRPSDLLIMNMSENDGWEKLCPFLEKPLPSVPYPRAYTTQEREATMVSGEQK